MKQPDEALATRVPLAHGNPLADSALLAALHDRLVALQTYLGDSGGLQAKQYREIETAARTLAAGGSPDFGELHRLAQERPRLTLELRAVAGAYRLVKARVAEAQAQSAHEARLVGAPRRRHTTNPPVFS